MKGKDITESMVVESRVSELNKEAEGIVTLALNERDKGHEDPEAIFREASRKIREEIFGRDLPAEVKEVADATPYLERLGEAFGKFEERALEDLSLEHIVRIGQRACRELEREDFTVSREDGPDKSFLDIDVRASPSKIVHQMKASGFTLENLGTMEVVEEDATLFRNAVRYDCGAGRLEVRGDREFVGSVLEGIEPMETI